MTATWGNIERQARLWMVEAGDRIKTALTEEVVISEKSGPDDLVTEVDQDIEAFFYEKISEAYPTHHFFGEEGVAQVLSSLEGTVWIVDPIDGTTNFIHQKRGFAISVAVYQGGEGMIGLIYDVMNEEFFHALKGEGAYLNDRLLPKVEQTSLSKAVVGINAGWLVGEHAAALTEVVRTSRGSRSYGSAALEMAYVATNRLNAYMSLNLSPWDYAAGAVILAEVGCKATRLDGTPLSMLEKGSLLASSSNLHEEIRRHLT
ncbi:inositol monophosphatase family protein [Shouchella lonarensis]|uniref:Myo-inositol-1(Or 4)-monophosphatase n=1 Tax=Shouchella lonarensis TaxID=1464122 RepID=A0A1G6KTC2_9BACI|nr:inositol monophosphatase family protein [Shouchella lonarensis]SDC33626.1 myo-inositol-1(or 4)-monophosphatase [Shouchella lonarensis]